MSEGLSIARSELERILDTADALHLKAVLRELIAHCEWQEREMAAMSARIDKLDRRTAGMVRR